MMDDLTRSRLRTADPLAFVAQFKREEEEARLLRALQQPMGFHRGKPMAASVIFRACLHWRLFQADKTSCFDRIAEVIGSQLIRYKNDNARLAYWLANTVTLLHLLQRNMKPYTGSSARTAGAAAARHSAMAELFGRQSVGGEAVADAGGVECCGMIEGRYPALLFRQQVDAFVQKAFPMLSENIKNTLEPMLKLKNSPRGMIASGSRTVPAGSSSIVAWADVLGVFDGLLIQLDDNCVPKPLVQALFKQLFTFVNVELCNQLLLRQECCSLSIGKQLKLILAQAKKWLVTHDIELVDTWDELQHLRQAVAFITIKDKPKLTFEYITQELCPSLSSQQLYRFSTGFWDDKHKTETVKSEVLAQLKQAMAECNEASSFLLTDNSTLPFAARDIVAHIGDKDLYVGFPVPESLVQQGVGGDSFAFLEMDVDFDSLCDDLDKKQSKPKFHVPDVSAVAAADSNLALKELKQLLEDAAAERDAALRQNLEFQAKLSSLQQDYVELQQVNKEAMKQLDDSNAQVGKLSKENEQLVTRVKQLENSVRTLSLPSARWGWILDSSSLAGT